MKTRILLIILALASLVIMNYWFLNRAYIRGREDGRKATWCSYIRNQFRGYEDLKPEDCK